MRTRTVNKKRKTGKRKAEYISSGAGSVPRGVSTRQGNRSITKISRSVHTGSVALTTGGVGGAFSFTLGDLPGYTDFTNLYDQYRIKYVKVEFMFNAESTNSGTNGVPVNYPYLITSQDLDDDTTPPSEASLLQHMNAKVHGTLSPMVPKFVRWVKPQMATGAYSGTFTSYASMGQQWIDSNSPGVKHYGLKYWVDGFGTYASNAYLQIISTYYLELKLPF